MACFAVESSSRSLNLFLTSCQKVNFARACTSNLPKLFHAMALSLLLVRIGAAQAPGIRPFSAQLPDSVSSIDLASGNIFVAIPLRGKAGKIPLFISLNGNSGVQNTGGKWESFFSLNSKPRSGILGWASLGGTLLHTSCNSPSANNYTWTNLLVTDSTGATHPFPGTYVSGPNGCSANYTGTSSDGTGLTLSIPASSTIVPILSESGFTLYDASGNKVQEAVSGLTTTVTMTDPDGVTMQEVGTFNSNFSAESFTYTDTLNQTALTGTEYEGPNSDTYTYEDANGSNVPPFTVAYSPYTFQTNFSCHGISEGSQSNRYLPTSITMPTGGTYSITYEQTPGYGTSFTTARVAKITLPSGGYVSYAYSGGNNGINCASGVVPTLTRKVYDGNTTSTWTYLNSAASTTPGNFTVVETDPANNQTVHNFAGEYQTQAAVYQGGCPTSITGCTGGGALLKTATTCYGSNGSTPPVPPNCTVPTLSPTLPITETDVYTSLNGSSTNILKTTFDTYGNTTSVLAYDFGSTTPTMQTFTIYGQSWNGTSCTAYPSGTYIRNTPCYRHTMNSSSQDLAKTQITYSNTGHPTSTLKWTGSSWLTSSATYNSNGTVATATDVNGTVSTPAYNGTGGCNGLLPTSVAAGGLTTSTQWDCNGGVVTQTTDANSPPNTYTYSHNDPLWRRTSMTDPLGNATSYSYATATTFEGAMNFNGTVSTSDNLTTVDGIGRQIFAQTRQAQGSSNPFDSIQTTYGWTTTGPFTKASMQYTGTAGQSAPSGTPVTTTQNDAVGRPLTITDGGGGTVSYTYAQNDVLSVLGPQPSGENNKQIQQQYDGLGRITKSCAIGNGSTTACGQSTGSAKGVTTSTAYTSGTGYQKVSSTRGSQTRSTTVDGLSRVTQKVTPEGGTWNYYYDSSYGSCPSGYTGAAGQLEAVLDPDGNKLCYKYDSLSRVTGVNANGTACRHFYYDNSTGYSGSIPSGVSTPTNPYGRMVEAVTDSCSSGTLITDEWFSYDKDGHVTDMWEKTPHSGTYYHSVATFAGNGVPLTVQLANPNLYTMTYGLDGEGRPNTLNGNSTTIVNGTTFNASGQPTHIGLGTLSDQSDYVYDPSTGRMTNWTFQVGNTGSETGTLTWNANGTLRQLAIVDGFNSAGTQTCTFGTSTVMGYDDLGRLLSDNCGSVWAQTFSYDQYNNITKSGSISWNPGYNAANNHYSTGASYDNSGNLTYDTIHLYTWDQFGKLSTIDSTTCGTNGECVTYDAMGRIVETSYNSAYTEIWYTQLGKEYMTGGSIPYYAYWPTPGNGTAEVNGNAVTFYYMHKDWLRSARISSVIVNPAVVSDQAYAPYGEVYNKLATGAGVPGQMFTGDTQDIIGGIFDTPNRELNVSQGRWLSPDPANSGWNQYAYVNNNPTGAIDPLGLWCFPFISHFCDVLGTYGQGQFGSNWNVFGVIGTGPTQTWWDDGWHSYTPTTFVGLLFNNNSYLTYLTNWLTGRTAPNTQYKLVRVLDCYAPGDAFRSSTYDLVGPPGVDTSNATITEHLSNPDVEGNGSSGVGAFEDQIGPKGAAVTEGTLRYFTVTNSGQNLGLVPVQYENGASYSVEGIWFNGDPQNPSNTQVFVNGGQAGTILAAGSCQN